jgi:ribosomal protein S27E
MYRPTRIDCPTCQRMGRATILTPRGHYSTVTCPTCSGEGWLWEHDETGCTTCTIVAAGMVPARPLFPIPSDTYA